MRARYELLELESTFQRLQQQVISLTAAHSQLTARERLLTAWCGALRLLNEHAGSQSDSLQDTAGSELGLHLLLPADTTTSTGSADPSTPLDTRSLKWFQKNEPDVHANSRELLPSSEGVYATIAPASDPAAFLRRLMAQQPLLPAAHSITADELAQLLREVTLEASMQQHLLGVVQGQAAQAAVLDKLEQLWARYFHVVVSLFLCGRMHVVESMATYNLEHLAVDPAGAAAHESVIQARVISELAFTPQQQQAIAVGGELYRARMHAITQAQHELQGSLGAAPTAAAAAPAAAAAAAAADGDESNSGVRAVSGSNNVAGPASGATCGGLLSGAAAAAGVASKATPAGGACGEGSSSSGVSSGRSSSSGGGVPQLDTLLGRLRELDALSHHTSQVERLLGVRGQLRLITCVWLVGCLSWPQWTLFATLCWPYCHRPAVLAETLMKRWTKQQQQQQAAVAGCAGPVPGSPQL